MSKPITFRFWIPEDTDTAPIDGHGVTFERLAAWLAALQTGEGYSHIEQLTEDEIKKTAAGIAEREYRATVRGFVEDLKEQIADGHITDRDEAREYLEQSIDGTHDVIYTYAAQEVCRISSNDGAYFDDFGAEGAITNDGIEWSKLAYCALLADVMEEIGDLDAWFTCSDCNGDVTPEDVKAAGDNLPVCASCRGEDDDEDDDESAERCAVCGCDLHEGKCPEGCEQPTEDNGPEVAK